MNFRFRPSKLASIISVSLLLITAVLVYVFLKPSIFSRVPGNQTGLPYQNSALSTEERVTDLMSRMTSAEKIGQMALIEKNSVSDLNDIARYGLGALMSGGGGKPDDNMPEGWLRMVKNFQNYSRKTRLGIPLLYGVDANHGHSNIPGATIFPHFIGLGATKDPNLVRDIARATAEEVAATGINWVYSPDLDVVQDTRWGRTYETFGSDSSWVGILGQAYIDGLQSYDQTGLKIAATAKHYIGNGSTAWGSSTNKNFFIDQGNSKISEDELRKIHLEPFKQAVAANVKSVMVGLNEWNGEKVSTNKHLLTDILKQELGFKGFVVSDWYGVYEKEPDKYKALVKAINAGVDMVMLPFDYKFFSESMHQALAQGDISQARVDDAVRRILEVKFEIGLFDKPAADTSDLKTIGSKPHRELARKAVRESLVLLKNNHAVPISKTTPRILVSGSAADNIGQQSGGWTVEWQGIDGNWIPGTSILKGIRDMVSPNSKVEYDLKGNFSDQAGLADVGIAIVGETPYAEGWGDKKDLKLSAQDVAAISNLKKFSQKTIVIIISGRPLNIKEYAKDWDAVIAAWLPGSEGQGVADALFGDYPFTGFLPVSWEL
ncbi:MAG: glycoside hydrolase family 3 protein [Patescibacteria group bacterium]|jgi:beta-glucosidase